MEIIDSHIVHQLSRVNQNTLSLGKTIFITHVIYMIMSNPQNAKLPNKSVCESKVQKLERKHDLFMWLAMGIQ